MSRLRLDLQYDGADFSGWQIQPNAPSIQNELEHALTLLNAQQLVQVVGCGRTDAGVHAKHYVAHCDFHCEDLNTLKFKLNGMLHRGIGILQITPVHSEFHARFDATKRTYKYFVNKTKNPFNDRYALYSRHPLDIHAMNLAAKHLLGYQDFTSFAKLHSDVNNHFCEIFDAFWTETEEQYIFEITANRFLRNMVRSIVGTLLDVGLHKSSEKEVLFIVDQKNRSEAGVSVPAKGLFLWEIQYPTVESQY